MSEDQKTDKSDSTPETLASKLDVFRAILSEIALKSGELRALVLAAGTMFASASAEEKLTITKDDETRKQLGAAHAFISMFTSQHFTAHVLQPFVTLVVSDSPLRGPETLGDRLSEGMTHAAMTCTCGGCIACKLKKDRGTDIASKEMYTRLRASVGTNQMAMNGMTTRGRA